jgi:hypothetical protein
MGDKSKYVNRRASNVGLSFKGDVPRIVGPGEVFEADPSEIPVGFLGTFIFPASAGEPKPIDKAPTPDVVLESTVEDSDPVNEKKKGKKAA